MKDYIGEEMTEEEVPAHLLGERALGLLSPRVDWLVGVSVILFFY